MDTLYWFSIPFVNAFNFSEVLINPLIIALLAAGLFAALGQLEKFSFGRLEGMLGLFLCCVVFSTCLNANAIDTKNINHLLAVFASYLVFYYLAVRISRGLTVEKILSILWVGYVFTTVFGIVEFLLVNFTGVDLSFIPRPSVTEYHPGFLDILLIRSRSLFEESGYYAAYMCAVAPLLVYYHWCVKSKLAGKVAFIALSITSYFVAFSVSLFIFLPLAFIFPTVIRMMARRRLTRRQLWASVALLCIAAVILSSDVAMELLFYRKFNGGSFDDRNDKFELTLELMAGAGWFNMLFGFGPGSYFRLGVPPAISVYLNFWRDFGLLGLSTYLAFVIMTLRLCYINRNELGNALFVSSIAIQLFYISTPTYFLPSYFIPLVLLKINTNRERRPIAPLPTSASMVGKAL